MAPQLFILGATGYIGGDFLYAITHKYPDWQITALVRNSDKGAKVAAVYPLVRLVYGDLDSTDLLEEEAAKADIVFNLAHADHEPASHAIAKGLASKQGNSFWIHCSGTGILGWETVGKNAFGDELPKVYNDWDGITELTSMPDTAPHRKVDKIVLAAGSAKLKVAVVAPPSIHSPGRGPDNQRTVQAPKLTQGILEAKKGWVIGKGQNKWCQVHVHDLTDLWVLLAEAAANDGSPATWNDEGYYLAEDGNEFMWGDVAKAITSDAHKKGLLSDEKVQPFTVDEAQAVFPKAEYYTGTNSRGTAIRANKLFGWKPHRSSIFESVSATVDDEAKRLGLLKGHAEKVAT